jgi:ribonucleoside-diphosphate reductase beta chain
MALDFSKPTNYGQRKMFLDPAGSVTIQRYDDYAYPKLAQFTKTQRGNFWVPDEISLTKDKIDFSKANDATKFIFTSNLLRQTALDSIQGRAPVQIFTPVCSVPEAEAWVQWWSAFEQIHSESYSHIIRNIYQMPSEQFNQIHDTSEIVNMLSGIDKYYADLHHLNSLVETGAEVSETKLVKAVYMALIASYGLEAIRFMVSFCTSLGMVENRIFVGNGNIISLILADELLHTDATAWMINQNMKDDYRFKEIAFECAKEAKDMLESVVAEEKGWAHYQFQKGTVLGMNEKIICSQVDYTAQERFKAIGIKSDAGIKTAPLPWMGKHLNTNKIQSALQENESVSYLISSMTGRIDYESLPSI